MKPQYRVGMLSFGAIAICLLLARAITADSNTSKTTQNITQTTIPQQFLSSPPSSPETSSWETYQSGERLYGISLTSPKDWTIKYKKEFYLNTAEDTAHTRIHLDFLPPQIQPDSGSHNWMGWGSLYIDVYDPATNTQSWLDQHLSEYKSGLNVKNVACLGGKDCYLLEAKPEALWADGWVQRYLVLGNEHSYILGSSQNGADYFMRRLEKEILPNVKLH